MDKSAMDKSESGLAGADVQRAASLLKSGGYTCVLCGGERVYTSEVRGVRYLMELLDGGVDVRGFSAADKVVGKATAMLLTLHGIKAVHAGVVSEAAERVLRRSGIPYTFDTRAERIINRAGTGLCPMEQAVWAFDDPLLAPDALRAAMAALRRGENA